MRETAIRPVFALLRALDDLDASRDSAAHAGRGTARRLAFNAKNRLPPGALDPERAARIAERWRRHFEDDFPPPEPTSAPPAEIATTYWLSSGDVEGAVLRARLERLPPRRRPWSEFWPCAVDAAAGDAADDAQRRAASLVRFTPTEPLRGWHRALPADGDRDAWRALQIEGRSLCAPLALMLLSEWLDRPLDPTLAVTGDLDLDLRLVLPGNSRDAVAAKIRAVTRERACIRTVLVPRGCKPSAGDACAGAVEVVEIDDLCALAERFGLPYRDAAPRPVSVQGWMQAVDEAEWLIRARAVGVPIMRARLEQLDLVSVELLGLAWGERAPRALDASRLRLLGRLCGYHAHHLDSPKSQDVNRRIDALLADCAARGAALPLAALATIRNVQASIMIDLQRFETARRYVAEARAAASTAQDGVESARIASTRGRIEAHARANELALSLLDVALAELEENIPWETNLCECYRVGVLGRLGRWDEAWAALERARARTATAPGVTPGWRSDNALYLDYEELKLALRQGDLHAAHEAFERGRTRADAGARGPWPASGILTRGIEARLRAGDRCAAEALLDALTQLFAAHSASGASLRTDLGRAAALLALHDLSCARPVLAAHRALIVQWVTSIPDGEESPQRAPRDACIEALADEADLAPALRALLDAEIY